MLKNLTRLISLGSAAHHTRAEVGVEKPELNPIQYYDEAGSGLLSGLAATAGEAVAPKTELAIAVIRSDGPPTFTAGPRPPPKHPAADQWVRHARQNRHRTRRGQRDPEPEKPKPGGTQTKLLLLAIAVLVGLIASQVLKRLI